MFVLLRLRSKVFGPKWASHTNTTKFLVVAVENPKSCEYAVQILQDLGRQVAIIDSLRSSSIHASMT
jgi:hypothetical protein